MDSAVVENQVMGSEFKAEKPTPATIEPVNGNPRRAPLSTIDENACPPQIIGLNHLVQDASNEHPLPGNQLPLSAVPIEPADSKSHSPATSRDSDLESSTSPPRDDQKRQAHGAGHTPPDEQYYMSERLIENSFQECCCVGVTGLFPVANQPPIEGIFPSLTINHGW